MLYKDIIEHDLTPDPTTHQKKTQGLRGKWKIDKDVQKRCLPEIDMRAEKSLSERNEQ